MQDPFAVLGLPPTARPEEIKARYRLLARQHHPDAGPTGSSARMAEINRAYDELTRDLEGCRRRATTRSQASARRPAKSRPTAHRRPVPHSKPESRTRQWKEWLERARRAAAEANDRQHGRPPRPAGRIRVSPSFLTLCRQHGAQELRVSGEAAHASTVLFPSGYFDVVRGQAGDNHQLFHVRLARDLPGPDGRGYIRVRNGSVTRTVPVYEFSCPTAEGSCTFAS